ncbi:MAG: hypothetical protein J6K42_06165 [Clostridia bacterium]|nr:hypothetical protein [Clostridia bacterium]
MFKAERIDVKYVSSSSVEHQGNYSSINYFLKQGYYVSKERNGYWLLIRPAKVIVTCYCGDNGIYTYNMKENILKYYKRARISQNLIDTFRSDFESGNLSIQMDETGFLIINNRKQLKLFE